MFDISLSLEDLTACLIKKNSVIGNEKEITDQIEKIFIENGLEIERVENSLIARMNLQKDKTVALVGHLDTVPLSRKNQTIPEVKDGNLIGLGACDMKCGIASALKILYEIKSGTILPKHNLVFVFYDGEEGPLPNGITRLIDKHKLNDIDFAYVLEPTCSKYSVGCLGALTIKIAIQGVSAHSANPKTGRNALKEAAKILKIIEETDYDLSETREIDGMPFYETINVTQLTTENASNVIPQKANLTINFRFSPKRTAEEAKEFVYSLIDKDLVYFVDCADSCFVHSEKTQDFLHGSIEHEIMQAWTDIAQLNAAGIPSVNFGAGDIKVVHKPEEFVNIDELHKFYELLKQHI